MSHGIPATDNSVLFKQLTQGLTRSRVVVGLQTLLGIIKVEYFWAKMFKYQMYQSIYEILRMLSTYAKSIEISI